MKIFIDAGHGGKDVGAVGKLGTLESAVNLEVALLLGKRLSKGGHEISYARTEDKAISLSERAALANQFGADLFVSIHCNSAKVTAASGTEVYCYRTGTKAEQFAKAVQTCLVKSLKRKDRGVKTANFAVLRETNMPAVLAELMFISNDEEERYLQDSVVWKKAAEAIYQGIVGEQSGGEGNNMAQTVINLENVWVQEIEPGSFGIHVCDCTKREAGMKNYFNLGFFAVLKGGETIPVGNLASDGKIIATSKDNESWLNVAGKKLTTLYTTKDGKAGILKTDDLGAIQGLKDAVSGIPIIIGAKAVTLDQIKAEGYFGNELYDTWHGFLGLRHGKLVYVAMKCGFDAMCWKLVALGIYDAIKVDGGGSFILFNEKEIVATAENRRIHNVGMWG